MQNNIDYDKWFSISREKKLEALEIITNLNQNLSINLEDGIGHISEHIRSDLFSLTIRALYQNKKVQLYLEKIDQIDEAKIHQLLENLKRQAEVLRFKEKDFIFAGSVSYPEIPMQSFNFTDVNIQKKYDLLLSFEKELLTQSCFLKTIDSICYSETFYQQTLVNSKGLSLEQKGSFADLSVVCVFQKKDVIEELYENFTVKNFFDFNVIKYAQQVISLGERKLEVCALKSNIYPTVFSNKTFASLLSSFSNIFSGLSAYHNLTKLKGQEGKMIAAPCVTIVDDPLCSKAFFQNQFDNEGVACFPKIIVNKGIFQQFIHNLRTAHIFNTIPTGNSFDNSITMSNCYLQKGKKNLTEIITSIKKGIYIDYLIGLHAGVDDISGDFSLQAKGFVIEKGQITVPIKMMVVSGNFFEILKNIKAIANDFVFKVSGFGSASVYVGELSIAGEK
ncbi:MAG: metallopeptidase TldD-related protein [Vigna little leaf phytoplasma]|nr:metallopeptidase TldD-related protein [Vigna little leaf phytoplasma]